MTVPNQTSAIVGTAIVGRTVVGVVLGQTSGLPQHQESGALRPGPWTLLPTQTTTWTNL